MKKNIIFLDIDGVMNDYDTQDRIALQRGIADEKVKILSDIVSALDADIVLTSRWKYDWVPRKGRKNIFGQYLDQKLARYGMHVTDVTPCLGTKSAFREDEIYAWLKQHKKVKHCIVLDDNGDQYFNHTGLSKHLVKTSMMDGLQEKHIAEAKEAIKHTIRI